MSKIHQFIIVLIMVAFSSASYAEMKYGVSGALTFINASGTETEGGETNTFDTDYDNYSIVYGCDNFFGIYYTENAWLLGRSTSLD